MLSATGPSEHCRVPRALARHLAPELREALEETALLTGEPGRRDQVHGEHEVAATPTVQVRDALSPETEHLPGLRPRPDPDRLGSVEGLDLQLSAEGGLHHRHVQHREEVLAATLEHGVLLHLDREVQVSGDPSRPAGVPLTRDTELDPVRDTGWDVD